MKIWIALGLCVAVVLAQYEGDYGTDEGSDWDSAIVSTECEAQHLAAWDCFQALKENHKSAMEERFAAKKEAMAACFTDNGCSDPRVEMEEVEPCEAQVVEETVLPLLDECAAGRFSINADLAQHLVARRHHGHHGHHGSKHGSHGKGKGKGKGKGQAKHQRMVSRVAAAVCPDNSQELEAKLFTCLGAVWGKGKGKGKGRGRGGRADWEQFKSDKAACKALIVDEDCREQKDAVKEELCGCGLDILDLSEEEKTELNEQLGECRAFLGPHDDDSSEEGADGRLGQIVERLCQHHDSHSKSSSGDKSAQDSDSEED